MIKYNMYEMKTVILTGLRANSYLHIGNYLGAILPIVDMAKSRADEFQINLFVPDLHSFTTPIDHSQLQDAIMNNLRVFVAAGLPVEHKNVYIYRQSYIPAHSELTWILDCFTGMGEMSRMTQYKEKSLKISDDRITLGLFNYPVLMAADILLYGATYVPVGDDQAQHIEFARDIGERMNRQFNRTMFTLPKPVKEQHKFFGKDQGLRIMDLADPGKKMSKSDETGKGVIFLSDSPEVAKRKIMSATTDSFKKINYNASQQPGLANMIDILALMSGRDKDDIIKQYVGQTEYGPLKQALSDSIAEFLDGFQNNLKSVDNSLILKKLSESEAAMNDAANQTLYKVQQAVGLRS